MNYRNPEADLRLVLSLPRREQPAAAARLLRPEEHRRWRRFFDAGLDPDQQLDDLGLVNLGLLVEKIVEKILKERHRDDTR